MQQNCKTVLNILGAKYISIKKQRQFQNFPVYLGDTSTKKTADYSAESFVIYVSNDFGIPQHFA